MKSRTIKVAKQDFPILHQTIHNEPLVYLDNAATTQKPKQVLEAMQAYYQSANANVHRGIHQLAERATAQYEAARSQVCSFLHAGSTKEILFTRGTTTSLNWVARFARQKLQAKDEVLLSVMEHHSNIVPWQQVCQETGAILRFVSLKNGELDIEDLQEKLTKKTKFVSLAHASNVLGSINPIKEITQLAHDVGAIMVVDGAQSAPHIEVDVTDLDCDFFAFSGHKLLGPTGIGVLYGKEKWLNEMEPVEFGGEMIDFVYEQSATWRELPWKFEAGTPPIAEAIGLSVAIDYIKAIGFEAIHSHEQELMQYLLSRLREIPGLTIYGPQDAQKRSGLVSFNLDDLHPHDVATALDYEGIAVRAGHHCAQPLMRFLDLPATVRASFYLYNTKKDCDRLVAALYQTKEFFHGVI